MEIFMKAGKNIAARSLMAVYSEYSGEHRFEPQNGKIYNSFGYIESGTVVMKSVFESLTAGSGDLIFIPEGAKYCSIWWVVAVHISHLKLRPRPFAGTEKSLKFGGVRSGGLVKMDMDPLLRPEEGVADEIKVVAFNKDRVDASLKQLVATHESDR